MKIVYFITNLDNSGGVERFIQVYANYLIKKNYEIEIVSLYSKNRPFYKFDSKIKIHSLELDEYLGKNKIKKVLDYLKILKLFYIYIYKSKPDFIIAQWIDTTSISSIVGKILNIKVIGYEHTNYKKVSIFYEFLRKKTYKYLDFFICLVQEDCKYYFKYLPKNKIHCINNPLSFKSLNKANLKNKKLLSIGRLSYEKGFDRLIDIISQLENNDWTLDIYGEDFGERLKLENKVKKLGLDKKIFFKGKLKNIKKAYIKSSIYLMTSRHEGFGNVLVEAMECGLPIISYDCPRGPREIIENNKNGILVSDGNAKEYTKELLSLMNDIEKRKVLSYEAQKKSKDYYIENLIKYWEKNIFNVKN